MKKIERKNNIILHEITDDIPNRLEWKDEKYVGVLKSDLDELEQQSMLFEQKIYDLQTKLDIKDDAMMAYELVIEKLKDRIKELEGFTRDNNMNRETINWLLEKNAKLKHDAELKKAINNIKEYESELNIHDIDELIGGRDGNKTNNTRLQKQRKYGYSACKCRI